MGSKKGQNNVAVHPVVMLAILKVQSPVYYFAHLLISITDSKSVKMARR